MPGENPGILVSGGRDVIDLELAAELDQLADQIGRMRPPQSHNPHAFHEDRSELAAAMRRLAQRCRTGEPTAPADVPAPIGRQAMFVETRWVNGRAVPVVVRRSQAVVADGSTCIVPADVR